MSRSMNNTTHQVTATRASLTRDQMRMTTVSGHPSYGRTVNAGCINALAVRCAH